MIVEQISNKENILNVACRLFAFRGYDSVSVQEIADEAGITKPTLYYYFGSKAGLIQALVSQKGGLLTEKIAQACEYRHSFVESITGIIRTEIAFARENPDYFRLHILLLNSPADSKSNALYAPVRKGIYSLFVDFFTKSTAEFGNMKGKEEFYSILFHNNLVSIAATVLTGFLKDDDETIRNIAHSFVYGVAN
ncbi:MAG: TetR/AcrR family transcriptional regulator [Treponema sp.]|nr:TetR/AcrR family transcriptional regulator [Treponema sp.]